jgi:hypothetical protein
MKFSQLSLWKMSFCDPYRFYRYDDIHVDWLGGWGRHIWELVLTVVKDKKLGAQLNAMSAVSCIFTSAGLT